MTDTAERTTNQQGGRYPWRHPPAARPVRLAVGAVLVAGLVASAFGAWGLQTGEANGVRRDFDREAQGRIESMKAVLGRALEQLHFVAGLYKSSDLVEEDEFELFVDLSLRRYEAIRSMSWIAVTGEADDELYELGFNKRQPDELMAEVPDFRAAGLKDVLARAYHTGTLALSRPLAGRDGQLLTALHVKAGKDDGFVAARIDIARLLSSTGAADFVLVRDVDSDVNLVEVDHESAVVFTGSLTSAGRSWEVALVPAAPLRTSTWRPFLLLGVGTLLSLLLAYAVAATTSRNRIQHFVEEQTVELERSNRWVEEGLEERVRIEEARRRLELQLRQIIDLVPHMIYAVDDQGRLLLVNRAAATAFGGTVDSLSGSNQLEAPGPRAWRDKARAAELDVIQRERPQLIPIDTFVDAQGDAHLLHTVRIPYTASVDDRPAVLCVAVDVTERVQAEGMNAAQGRVLTELARGEPLERVLTTLVEAAEEITPGMAASILLLDEDGCHLRHGAGPSLPADYIAAVDGIEIGPGVGSCGAAAAERRSVIVENIQTHPNWEPYRDLARRAGLGACWSHPVFSSTGEVLGTLAMYYRDPRSPNAFELELIGNLARLAGIAIERFRRVEELRAPTV